MAFADSNILPKEILYRTKEAFSDGVSTNKKSWYQIIQDDLENSENKKKFILEPYNYVISHNIPTTPEQRYYRKLFQHSFGPNDNVIPYFWMPRFIEATDSSARTLNIYNQSKNI